MSEARPNGQRQRNAGTGVASRSTHYIWVTAGVGIAEVLPEDLGTEGASVEEASAR